MEEGLNHETLPLLGTTQPHRLHYLDNLRATLTVVLIFHHVAKQVSTSLELQIPILTNRTALWALFFFVSGRSATLAFSGSSDYNFLLSRVLKIGLPASIYALFLRPSLVVILSLAWKSVFGVPGVYTKLSGPTTYVSILLSLDFIYLFLRWCVRQGPNYSDLPFLTSLRITSHTHFVRVATLTTIALVAFNFLQGCLYQIQPHSVYSHFFDCYDQPGADAPLSYIIAYLAGIHFESLKEFMLLRLPEAYIFLFGSFALSYAAMAFYFFVILRSIPFTSLRLIIQIIFFAVWDPFVFCTIPISVISIFSQAPWATREWGFLARHTLIQTYINMVPILLADHFVRVIGEPVSQTLLTGLVGVVVSWAVMVGSVILWGSFVQPRST